jgi:hypothetical protein
VSKFNLRSLPPSIEADFEWERSDQRVWEIRIVANCWGISGRLATQLVDRKKEVDCYGENRSARDGRMF